MRPINTKAKDKARDNVERMVAATKRLEALLADPGPGIIVRRLPPAQNDDTPPLTAAPPIAQPAEEAPQQAPATPILTPPAAKPLSEASASELEQSKPEPVASEAPAIVARPAATADVSPPRPNRGPRSRSPLRCPRFPLRRWLRKARRLRSGQLSHAPVPRNHRRRRRRQPRPPLHADRQDRQNNARPPSRQCRTLCRGPRLSKRRPLPRPPRPSLLPHRPLLNARPRRRQDRIPKLRNLPPRAVRPSLLPPQPRRHQNQRIICRRLLHRSRSMPSPRRRPAPRLLRAPITVSSAAS